MGSARRLIPRGQSPRALDLMSLRKRFKATLKGMYGIYVRRRYHFTADDLEKSLRVQGVSPGDVLLVHSSFDSLSAFSGRPSDVVNVLLQILGKDGTLLMPTMSFTGSATKYVESTRNVDLRRCPSRMGLITEIFRRWKGVTRSVHPTHSVACYGRLANELARDHQLATTPCGKPSPYSKLSAHAGKILLLGTGLGAMTLFHYLEEELESRMPFSPFTKKRYQLSTTDLKGECHQTETRLFEPTISRRRNLDKLKAELVRAGFWNEWHIGNLNLILLNASDVSACCHSLADRDVFCYDN